jgi:hypothetical protein
MTDQRHPDATASPCANGAAALCSVILANVRNGDHRPTDETWRQPARVICHDARARGLQVEDLIIVLKQTWPAVARAERLSRDESSRLLARVVTLCVEEYYGSLG